MDNKNCDDTKSFTKYQSVAEAQQVCNKDITCGFVYDNKCDGANSGIYTCPKTAFLHSSTIGSCVYQKFGGNFYKL